MRDALLGRAPKDWDLATDARPDAMLHLFPGAVYENAFGTVAVRRDGEVLEITTFRNEHEYADFRRPHRLEFGDDIRDDLARRDFTVNAIAWGVDRRRTPADGPPDRRVNPRSSTRSTASSTSRRGVLRAVGDPGTRFREDALRMVRAVRLAAMLEVEVEPRRGPRSPPTPRS